MSAGAGGGLPSERTPSPLLQHAAGCSDVDAGGSSAYRASTGVSDGSALARGFTRVL